MCLVPIAALIFKRLISKLQGVSKSCAAGGESSMFGDIRKV